MADDVLRRMKEYETKQKKRRKIITAALASISCIVLIALAGFWMWQRGIFGTATPPDLENPIVEGDSDKTNDNIFEEEPDNFQSAQFQKEWLTFEEIILRSNVGIVGECMGAIIHDNYAEVKFKVKECLYGNVTNKEIYMYSNLPLDLKGMEEWQFSCGYYVAAEHYEKGKSYILILERWQSIMYDHDRYMRIDNDLFMCEDDNEYILNSQVIEVPEGMEIKDYICSVYNSVSHPEVEVPPVYESELEEMVGESAFIGVVKILSLVNEGKTSNGNLYKVRVESLLKEEVRLNKWSVSIKIFKDTVEIGKSYIIGFCPVDEHSLIHTQTTRTGVYEVNDEILAEIEKILEK